jgi:hypothetical protein
MRGSSYEYDIVHVLHAAVRLPEQKVLLWRQHAGRNLPYFATQPTPVWYPKILCFVCCD